MDGSVSLVYPAAMRRSRIPAKRRPPGPDDAALEVSVAVPAAGATSAGAVLYLHGFGSSQDGEKADRFRGRARDAGLSFVALDFQGHGRSGGDVLGLSLSRSLRDVERARAGIDELRTPVYVIGSSFGGLVALWHAATSSLPVTGLTVIAPALGIERVMAEQLGAEGLDSWRERGSLTVTNELGSFDLGWEFVADLERYPTDRLVALHSGPTQVFQGRRDDRVSWREVVRFAEATPESTHLDLIEDGDHRLLDEMDRIVAATLVHAAACNPTSGEDVQ